MRKNSFGLKRIFQKNIIGIQISRVMALYHIVACKDPTFQNTHVPVKLDLYIDSFLTLTLSASYRQIDRFILFDKREIAYILKNKTEPNLIIKYQSYLFDIMQKEVETVGSLGKYTAKLKKAAVYARKAVDALNKGDSQTALNLLQTIIENYPGTPQAVEAQKILSGLPNGL